MSAEEPNGMTTAEAESELLDKLGPATFVGHIQSLCAANADFTEDSEEAKKWKNSATLLYAASGQLHAIWGTEPPS